MAGALCWRDPCERKPLRSQHGALVSAPYEGDRMSGKPKTRKNSLALRVGESLEFCWAGSQEQATKMEADGWQIAQTRLVLHNHYGLLYVRKVMS